MRYLSVCAGIEAATVAWHDLGWQPVAFSEIEPFPSAVLAHHYPNVPNLGDMTKFKEWDIGTIDLLVGGTPCQSFSVAGLRKGLEDPRGNLALTYVGILDKFRPKWFVWENVLGVLSSGSGRDFGSFLGALGQIGYGFAYRVLDAQYFGVAQRRRRVFVVGCLGAWRSAAEVLFEPHSLSGDNPPSREKREVTPTLTKECTEVSRTGHNEDGWYIPTISKCITRGIAQRYDFETETMIPIALAKNTIGRQPQNGGNGDGFTVGGPMYTLNATGVHGVAQPIPLDLRNAGRDPEKYDEINRQGVGVGEVGDPAHTLTAACVHGVAHPTVLMDQGGSVMNVLQDGTVGTLRRETHGHEPVVMQPIIGGVDYENNAHGPDDVTGPLLKGSPTGGGRPLPAVALASMAVRRLTPTECERLQGFPDGYTNIPWRKKEESPDGPRYKSLGNSMAVPVMAWIGKRIANAS
jgi:DNA (cytosine-5)-methyltransferase 1